MFAIAIKDLKVYCDNSNLFLGKNAIWFEWLVKKKETSKQTAVTLYYKYQMFISQGLILVLEKHRSKSFYYIKIRLL